MRQHCSSCDGCKQECQRWRPRRWQLRPQLWSIQSILCYVYPWQLLCVSVARSLWLSLCCRLLHMGGRKQRRKNDRERERDQLKGRRKVMECICFVCLLLVLGDLSLSSLVCFLLVLGKGIHVTANAYQPSACIWHLPSVYAICVCLSAICLCLSAICLCLCHLCMLVPSHTIDANFGGNKPPPHPP